jgi:hypothetical protein
VSTLVEDMLGKAVKRVGRIKKPDWLAYHLHGDHWEQVSAAMMVVLDEAKGHGAKKPLALLQELAFSKSLEPSERGSVALQTVALWLTSTRIHAESYAKDKNETDRRVLEQRGLIKRSEDAEGRP